MPEENPVAGKPDYFVHESSYIDDGAEIGADTRIWHFCHVAAGAKIGAYCRLGQNVYVAPGALVGNHVKIQNNVAVYDSVVLEDYVFCGPGAVFTNMRTPRSAFPRNTTADRFGTRVKLGASLGANSTIVCGTTVGEWALIGAGAVVTRDVAAFALMAGVPARRIGWACRCGLTLKRVGAELNCSECGRQYEYDESTLIERTPA
jgi:UDP-2-acetamido-3-amino-2,3-dideoxy-glucuronate N-acetyltransferase